MGRILKRGKFIGRNIVRLAALSPFIPRNGVKKIDHKKHKIGLDSITFTCYTRTMKQPRRTGGNMVSQNKLGRIIGLLEHLEKSSPKASQEEQDRMSSAKSDLIRIYRS